MSKNYWLSHCQVPDFDNPRQYQALDLWLKEGTIAGIYPTGAHPVPTGAEIVEGTNKLLLPGWVNAHTHSMEMWTRGLIPPLPLELWLAELYAHPIQSLEQLYLAASLTAVETLLSGGTTVVDHLVLIPGQELESLAAADRAYREAGIRAYIAPLIQDEAFEYSIPGGRQLEPMMPPMPTAEVLALMEAIVRKFHHPQDGIEIGIGPTGIQLCTDALFEGCIDLSDRHNLCRHGHLLETKAQEKLAQEKYGTSAVVHLAELGWLSPKTSLAHCVWLDDRDIELMAETGTTVVHNPLSNLRLGSGIAPLLRYRDRGVNVSYGCDGAASNDGQSLFEVLKIGSMLHNTTDFDYRNWISPQAICRQASQGGALGLNSKDYGRLEVGQSADLVLFNLDDLSLLPAADPLGQLIWGRPGNVVDSVWVRGKQVVANGQPITVNVRQLSDRLRSYCEWLETRPLSPSPMRQQLESTYRQSMGLSQ
ncbi:MAG: amidohydrolase [Cyanobacteria bacterium P01_A01_bin.3]